MKLKKRISAVLFVAGLFIFTHDTVNGQTHPSLVEIAPKSKSIQTAPIQAIETFRSFFKYLSKSETNLGDDKDAQIHWISADLRSAMMEKKAFEGKLEKENPTDKREYPSNDNFVGAWDFPSTYSIVGSRLYGDRTIIDVEYKWDKGTNYEGNMRLMSFIFIKDGGKWKLDDVYTFRGEFESAESLSSYFRQN